MARVVYAMLTSVDGYVAGPQDGPQLPIPEEALHRHFNERLRATSVALYGRGIYEVMREWETRDQSPDAHPIEVDFARAWRDTPKVVFSRSLSDVGPGTRLVRDRTEEIVAALKADLDGEIAVSGPTLAASLTRQGLIDEYRLYMHPVALGGGKPYFAEPPPKALTPLGTETMTQGVVMVRYGR